jgi:hypothetical protein
LERRVAGLVPEDKRRPAEPVALQEADTRVVGRPGRMIAGSRCSAPGRISEGPGKEAESLGAAREAEVLPRDHFIVGADGRYLANQWCFRGRGY